MRKSILLAASLLASVSCFAQESVEPELVPGVYALKISPNGKWVGSMAGDGSLYNTETGDNTYYSGIILGLGNAVADNGMAVGDMNDVGALLYNGKTSFPPTIADKFWFCDFNSITPDATRICGILNNPIVNQNNEDREEYYTMYVPFVADIDADGNVGEPIILPYPEVDFFGVAPEYITAVWMSRDGKTIVGEVLDGRGQYSYPIYFTEDEKGEWNYELPSKSLFNPTGIDLPKNPWAEQPPYPNPEDFMSGQKKTAYLEAYQAYVSGESEIMPDPEEYMNPTQLKEYEEAIVSYNQWFYGQGQAIADYIKIYNEVLKTSPTFSGNELTIEPSGEYLMIRGGLTDDNFDIISKIYKFGITNDEIQEIETPTKEYYPSMILPDGTLIITKGLEYVPNSYIMLPDSNEFITLQEYLEPEYPEIAEWLDAEVPGGTGVVSMNDDRTIITGALIPDQLADSDYANGGYYYNTYFILLGNAGVESIVDNATDGIYKVYDLNGVKVMETKDASVVNNLPKGIYIINGKKILK
ncbi:MAG: hypothetical protein J1E16_00850 [Muribaculaceae bacterium]|nr:hypothetical protein [Muribaculaceae bacterium]